MIKTHLFIQQNIHSDKDIPTGNLFPTMCQLFIFVLLMFLFSLWLTHSWLCTLSHFPRRPLFYLWRVTAIFFWMEMLPSSCHCNLKQGCFIASEKTPGTLLHTHIYLLPDVHRDFHCKEKLCDSKRLCLSWNKGLFRIKIKLQHFGEERRNLTRKALQLL